MNLGRFDTPAEAALARDLYCVHRYGAEAQTNFLKDVYQQELERRAEVWLTHARTSCFIMQIHDVMLIHLLDTTTQTHCLSMEQAVL